MYSDNNFFVFTICIFVIIGVSQTLLRSCSIGSPIMGLCNLFMIVLYPILIYLVVKSIEETKHSQQKTTRHLLNALTLVILCLVLLFNISTLFKLKLKVRGKLSNY